MDFWAGVLAIIVPVGPAAILAYFLRWRALFWGVVIGAIVGFFFLRPAEAARYHDPREQLIARTRLGLQGTIPCSTGGLAIAWIVTRRERRAAKSEQ